MAIETPDPQSSDHSTGATETNEPVPLVIVEGFLGCAGVSLWGDFEQFTQYDSKVKALQRKREVIFASVGPVSSLHDRACELFYALRGGTVDYGEKHSRMNGHGRYGRTHNQGLYPQWSSSNPLHFLGHSLGGPTIIKLQWLISTRFFGSSHHADMLLSVTTISAPFRGTQLVYSLGEHLDGAPSVRPFSLGSVLAKGIHIASYLSPIVPSVVDLHTESRSLSFHETSFPSLLKQLWHSDWAEGRDATPYDVTFEASEQRENSEEGSTNPRTFYRSYAATMTRRKNENNMFHSPSLRNALHLPLLYFSADAIGSFDFSSLTPTPSFLRDIYRSSRRSPMEQEEKKVHDPEVYWANDGVIPLFSQWHPFACSTTRCQHYDGDHKQGFKQSELPSNGPQAGIWHVYHLEDANHFSIAPFWLGTSRQKAFWRDIGQWLHEVDRAHFTSASTQ